MCSTPVPVFYFNASPDERVVLTLRPGVVSIALEATFMEQDGPVRREGVHTMTSLVRASHPTPT